ncbi:hypothetical protein SBX64_16115 [Vibrio rhizosphaerae]|uniref:Uncharacterized protein n=1 Tax=Vibrio rhizosphaerae TaxID=398736 RepID=A0ABU4IXD6_9VIBR|nr:hypothetical protein [Vibrio rhizosphaerae]MDW6094065.1 hypothetical protein [Vibrio rhizosphaerae]
MALDTRGLMDGALRGFEMMDNYYRNQHSQKYADEQMKMARENQAMSLKAHDQQMKLAQERSDRERSEFDAKYGPADANGNRTGGWLAKQQEQQGKLADAQLAANKSKQELNKYQLNQQQKTNYINENLPVLQSSWGRWMTTGESDDIFDNEFIKGSSYDPRRYLSPKINDAFDVIESKLPQITQGQIKSDDPEFVSALGVMYEGQIKASVGQQDPITGKTIKDAKLGGVHLASDIDPHQPGDQPGIVLTTMVDYGAGKWVAKPITNNRSTDQNDAVKVIPLERAMKDITSQLALRRQVASSDAYKTLFNKGNKKQSKYEDAVVDLQKEKVKALNQILSPETEEGQKQIAAINDQYNSSVQELRHLFLGRQSGGGNEQSNHSPKPGKTNVPQWAKGDPAKLQLARALQANGYDVGNMTEKDLNDAWTIKQEKENEIRRIAREKGQALQLVEMYKDPKKNASEIEGLEMARAMSGFGGHR